MGGPPEVDDVQYPSWMGQALAGGKELNTALTDYSAAATDATQLGGAVSEAVDKIPDFDVPYMDPVGGVMTGISQIRQSTVQNKIGKVVDGALAGGADVGMPAAAGAVTALIAGKAVGALVGPAVPVADFLLSKATGGKLSLGDTVNGAIRGGLTAAEAGLSKAFGTGTERGTAAFTARAETGQYGWVVQKISGLITGRKG